ncbi:uncharacterized protein LOC110103360 [Dendrobium catenatum]|uniref:uncharacterized protein LOC110103360 n=1 Tax=Dendrobium catenatum TaxID=906689 RepID=UPI0009F29CF9|nr:uncharacterized protein LOC110103360 [Dendrobium catenatum]
MGDQESSSSLLPSSTNLAGTNAAKPIIPAPLKFLISNIKTLLPHPLTPDNYAIWRIEILQQFMATGYVGHLNGTIQPPQDPTSPAHGTWMLIDSTLISALFSTISPTILSYVITASTAKDVWTTLERSLQPASCSRVIQLKNELHHIQMKNLSMQQYLTQVKTIVDNIVASGSQIDPEDIILYILNGLPASYNSFKTSIRTSPLLADLDSLYSLLCSEEIHVNQDPSKKLIQTTRPYMQLPTIITEDRHNVALPRSPRTTAQLRTIRSQIPIPQATQETNAQPAKSAERSVI